MFVQFEEQETIAFWQSIEDDEVKIDLLAAVAIGGSKTVGSCVGVLGMVNHQSGHGSALIFLSLNGELFIRR